MGARAARAGGNARKNKNLDEDFEP